MKAQLSSYRQSPRKVRQVANLIRGKKTGVALTELSFLPKRAALPIQKLIACECSQK
jgi:large subunit ribosomal protein L22